MTEFGDRHQDWRLWRPLGTRPGLSVIIPTLGRPTLDDTIRSIVNQGLTDTDQVIVIRDSHGDPDDQQHVRERMAAWGCVEYREYDAGQHYYGGTAQANDGLTAVIPGNYVLALGDDDVYVDGAFTAFRPHLASGRPIICKVFLPWREVLPVTHSVIRHRINGSGFLCPSQFVPPFALNGLPSADYDWMRAAIAANGREPIWLDRVWVIARPERRDGRLTTKGVTHCAGCSGARFLEDLDAYGYCLLCAPVGVPA